LYREEYAFFESGVTENVVPAGTKKLHSEFNEDPELVLAIAYSVQTTVLDSLWGDMVGDVVLSPKPKYSMAPLTSNNPSQ
jgi:hypothetical protein